MKQASLLLVLVVSLAIGLGFVTGAFVLGPVGATDTSLHVATDGNWIGGGCTGNNPTSDSSGHLIDMTEYIASYDPGLIGQRVTLQAFVRQTSALVAAGIQEGRYKLSIDQHLSGVPIITVLETSVTFNSPLGSQACAPSVYWDILAPDNKTVIPEGSVLAAEFFVRFALSSTFSRLAWQNADVHTGIGIVNRERGGVVTGEDACFRWHVGYVTIPGTKNPGWVLTLTSGARGYATVKQTTLTQTDGRLCYTTATADFSTSSPNNEIVAHLKNNLWDKSFDIITTVSEALAETRPICAITGASPQSPRQNEQVTVSFSCSAKDAAHPIAMIKIQYGWGGIDHTEELPSGTTSYSFVASKSGTVRWMVIAYTKDNVPSETESQDFQIEHQAPKGCGPGTDQSTCTTQANWIALIGAAIVLVIGLIVATGVGRGKPLWFVLIFLGFVAAALFAYVALGGAM